MSRTVHLQQHLYDLRERERLAKLHNRELLQQFEEAQKTLRGMLDCTAAMKKIRNEYESYFWSCSHLDNQLHLKTTQENMPGVHQTTCQKNSETSKCKNALLSQGHGKIPRSTGAYQGIGFPPGPSWQTPAQTQISAFPKQASEQPWDITQSPAFSFPHSYLVGSHLLPSAHRLQPCSPLETRTFTDHPGPGLLKYLADCNTSHQHYTHNSSPQSQKQSMPKPHSTSPSGLSEENNRHSEDIDMKPVRLSSHQGVSRQTSSQGSTPNKDSKSNRSSSSEAKQHSTHKSSTKRAAATNLKAMALRSESNNSETSSHRTSKQSCALGFKENQNKLENSTSHNEDNESDTEACNSEMSGSDQVPQGSVRIKPQNIAKPAETKLSTSDQSSPEDEDENSEKEEESFGDKGTSHKNDKEKCNADIPRCSSDEADQETDESEEDDAQENTESASSDCDGGEDNMEEPESNKDKGQKDTIKAPEDSDSDDCIVSPQTRSKIIYVIPEHASEHEESSRKTPSLDDHESRGSSENIEQVLAPKENTQTEREQSKSDEAKVIIVGSCNVKEERQDHQNDTSESDDFYD